MSILALGLIALEKSLTSLNARSLGQSAVLVFPPISSHFSAQIQLPVSGRLSLMKLLTVKARMLSVNAS